MTQNKSYSYVIESYQKEKPFSSFLSGIAGHMGIPLWSFYVNRGQLISSFGVRDKNGSIMEFHPANLAYHYVSKMGFRTFVKVNQKVYEFFKEENSHQSMIVSKDQVSIIEENKELKLKLKISYFTLPNESVAALVRKVELFNLDDQKQSIELIDGLAQILPSGIEYGAYKAISNLLQSWMSSIHEGQHIFYKLRASTGDSAEVSDVVDGNFYMTFGLKNALYISDYKLIFDEDSSLQTPYLFKQNSIQDLKKINQTHVNQVPCAMTGAQLELDQSHVFFSLIGYAHEKEVITQIEKQYTVERLLDKEVENRMLHDDIVSAIETKTSEPLLDAYFKQCYLDNVLRGGTPWIIETQNETIGYYLYSRKHGDLERDYNFFNLEPSYFSQGNGNFRDVLQNRRNDIFFEPKIGDFNIYQFGSLIQADGYNPLSIEGVEFQYNGQNKTLPKEIKKLLEKPFTPGKIALKLAALNLPVLDILKQILSESKPIVKASFGEGYWEDHFTYLYDLIDAYLSVYPDDLQGLMFEKMYPFFRSPAKVLPRSQKYVLNKEGKVRQYGALKHWHDSKSSWLENSEGELKANLFGKLVILVLNKYGHLDPFGIGLSYEANKPGWNDAANGIPGLFGSGVSETIELLRIVKLLLSTIEQHDTLNVHILKSADTLIKKYSSLDSDDDFNRWDQRVTALEKYREMLESEQEMITHQAFYFKPILTTIKKELESALEKAKNISPIYPTYITYEATSYDMIVDENGNNVIGDYGLPLVKINAFEMKQIPHFLEAPARYLKALSSVDEARDIYAKIKQTGLYDKKLKMYQTSESLEACNHEIGRLRAFTPGWLERESNFLHMTYKYLLGLLKSGVYDVFFEEIKNNYTCFMDPKVYGRSPVENSSFIATSGNPDPKKHGQGFVSRLTGSTAEALSMWRYMFLGDHLLSIKHDQLTFKLDPKLPAEFFKEDQIYVKLFNHIDVYYHNPEHLNTYDSTTKIKSMIIKHNEDVFEINDDHVVGKWAKAIRDGQVSQIDVYFTKA